MTLAEITIEGRPAETWLDKRRVDRTAEATKALASARRAGHPSLRLRRFELLILDYSDVRAIAFQAEYGAAEAENELGRLAAAVERLERTLSTYPSQTAAARRKVKSLVNLLKRR